MKFRKPTARSYLLKNGWFKKNQQSPEDHPSKHLNDTAEINALYPDLQNNMDHIKQIVGNSSDIVFRECIAGDKEEIHIAFIYTDGLADKNFVQEFLLKPIMLEIRNADLTGPPIGSIYQLLKSHSIPAGDLKDISDFEQLFGHLLSGDTIILIHGHPVAFAADSRGWAERGIEEATTQPVVRGPKEGFTETLRVNTSLIRRRIKDPNLRIETKQIGKRSKTDVAIVYLNGVVDEGILKELKSRLNRIDTDAILESGYIEEFIQDETYTPFPTVFNTERPDVAAGGILEGRIAIIVDGTPFVLLVPAIFAHFFQVSEDYFQRADFASLIRFMRYLSFFLALLTPSAYIALTTYHQEMLPTQLLISLAAQREGVPFPAVIEALLMEVTFEFLREAAVRMPKLIGPAITIVGALVIGQTAVEAGIVSSAMVIVVSVTAISNFVPPSFNMAISIRILRFVFMILASTFGMFGITIGLIIMVNHLSNLRSFGVPYLTPSSPFILRDQKDVFVRVPTWAMNRRPHFMKQKDSARENSQAPKPPQDSSNE